MNKLKGQIPVVTSIIGAVAMLGAAILSSWGISSRQVAVVEERENNHYAEVKSIIQVNIKVQEERWNRIESILDRIAPPTVKITKDEDKVALPALKEEVPKNAPIIRDVDKSGRPIQ